MPDVLAQGEDRDPSPRSRRVLVAAVLAVALAALVLTHLPHHRPAPAHPPQAAGQRHQPPVGLPPPGLHSGGLPDSGGLPAEPDGVIGPTAAWDASSQLPVTGAQPRWYRPATGRSEPIGGLPRSPAGYLFTRIGGGWAVQPSPGAPVMCASCAGPPQPVYFLAEGAAAQKIGEVDEVAPGAAAGTIWVTNYLPGSDRASAAGTAQEVTVQGQPLRPPVTLPAGYAIARATSHGLLLAPVAPRPGQTADKLWAPPSGTTPPATGTPPPATIRASRSFSGVIAASPAKIAWLPTCAAHCRLELTDLAGGHDTSLRLPVGSCVASGAFSPDGKFLALQVRSPSSGDSGASPTQLVVVTVASGHLTKVPGTSVSSDALDGFGWPVGTDSLVAELSFTTKVQVASWHPGALRPAVAEIRPTQELNLTSMIVG
ncbi:MAG: hypothetical protein ABJB47_07320 [Actinomycetota bacterium]